MDFREVFENLGLGFGIIIILFVLLIFGSVMVYIVPVLLRLAGGIIVLFIGLVVILVAVYFLGKFAKGFIR